MTACGLFAQPMNFGLALYGQSIPLDFELQEGGQDMTIWSTLPTFFLDSPDYTIKDSLRNWSCNGYIGTDFWGRILSPIFSCYIAKLDLGYLAPFVFLNL